MVGVVFGETIVGQVTGRQNQVRQRVQTLDVGNAVGQRLSGIDEAIEQFPVGPKV